MIDKKKMFWEEKQTNHHKSTKMCSGQKSFSHFSKITFLRKTYDTKLLNYHQNAKKDAKIFLQNFYPDLKIEF